MTCDTITPNETAALGMTPISYKQHFATILNNVGYLNRCLKWFRAFSFCHPIIMKQKSVEPKRHHFQSLTGF